MSRPPFQPTCSCDPAWPSLVATIDGQTRPARRTRDPHAAETAGQARCGECNAVYPNHWTLAPIDDPEGQAAAHPPSNAVDLLRLLVSERPDGEVRPQQERMVAAVEDAINAEKHLIVQAGTGTGKSIGYALPAVAAEGKRIVISTATKQLGEQLMESDLPTLAKLLPKVGGEPFTYTLIKGRNNYACKRKIADLTELDDAAGDSLDDVSDALFEVERPARASRPSADDLKALNALLQWAEKTRTGDRSEAPAAPDKMWAQVSTDAAECPGAKSCKFGEECFAEFAREKARYSDVVVANHALVAVDFKSPQPTLGDWDVLIADEVHELESYLSSAWGHDVSSRAIKDVLASTAKRLPKTGEGDKAKETLKSLVDDATALDEMLDSTEPGLKPQIDPALDGLLATITDKLLLVATGLDKMAQDAGKMNPADIKAAAGKVRELVESVTSVRSTEEGTVRWLEGARERYPAVLKTAPLWVGPQLMAFLGDRTLIATSATITVGDSFEPMIRTLALREDREYFDEETGKVTKAKPRPFDAVDVGTPFDYPKQGMLYIPGGNFPAPVGKDRFEHTEAVLEELVALVTAAGGRTLALFTTTYNAKKAAEHLRKHVSTPVLAQGDAPASQLIREFTDDEATTLCATMGFWHGVNVPGPSLSVVVIDKIPFAPQSDPLMSARRTAVDEQGRDGFHEVYTAGASIMLAQGSGRLIRTATDRGVIAILDTRIMTNRRYGDAMLRSLPGMRVFRDRDVVTAALTRITGGTTTAASPSIRPAPKPSQKAAVLAGGTVRRAAPSASRKRAIARGVRKSKG